MISLLLMVLSNKCPSISSQLPSPFLAVSNELLSLLTGHDMMHWLHTSGYFHMLSFLSVVILQHMIEVLFICPVNLSHCIVFYLRLI